MSVHRIQQLSWNDASLAITAYTADVMNVTLIIVIATVAATR